MVQYPTRSVNCFPVCPRRGAQPSSRERAVAGGPVGCADGCGRTGRAHAQTNIQNNSFIIPFISIHLLNNFLMFRSPAFSSQFSCKFLANNSFSTTVSSVNFFGKSIPLPFYIFPSCAKSVKLLSFFSMKSFT